MKRAVLLLAIALALVQGAVAAPAKDGDGEVRVTGRCTGGVRSEMRVRARDGGIEVRLEVDRARVGTWNVTLVHERRVAWRGKYRVRRAGGSFEVRRTLADLPGADAFTARALGPRGLTCRADATLAES